MPVFLKRRSNLGILPPGYIGLDCVSLPQKSIYPNQLAVAYTDYYPCSATKITVSAKMSCAWGAQGILGSRSDEGDKNYFHLYLSGDVAIYGYGDKGSLRDYAFEPQADVWYTYALHGGDLYVNGEQFWGGTGTWTVGRLDRPVTFFSTNTEDYGILGDTSHDKGDSIGRVTIEENGVVLRDYYPCVCRENNYQGWYDIINRQFIPQGWSDRYQSEFTPQTYEPSD